MTERYVREPAVAPAERVTEQAESRRSPRPAPRTSTFAVGHHDGVGTYGAAPGARCQRLVIQDRPVRQDLARVVCHHLQYGRTVVLVHDLDVAPAMTEQCTRRHA
jgi:hypothetical protein